MAGEGVAAAKTLSEKGAENLGMLRVEGPAEVGVHGGGACLNGIGGAGTYGKSKNGALCKREQARRRGECDEEVVAQADPETVSSGGVGAGVEGRLNTGACTEPGLGDPRGHSDSAGQVLVATDRACSKRPRKEEERGAQ